MHLQLSDEQKLLRDTFAQLFVNESSPERVRSAERLGFDAALWTQLAGTGALGMRVPQAAGGGGASLLDAAVVAEEAGRRLASVPLVEALVAGRLLAGCAAEAAREWLARFLDGSAVISLALRNLATDPAQLVPGGAAADLIVALDGRDLVLLVAGNERRESPSNLGSAALSAWSAARCERTVLSSGAAAERAFAAALEEWKLLTAAAVSGLAREALEIAARYASERIQFDRPIGSFQGIAHPLAESASDVEAARLLVWKTIWAIATARPEAAALVSTSFVWAAGAASRAVARALHTHGGYGLSLEYDIQLYHRRGKAWPLVLGDPEDELLRVADRLWGEAAGTTPLPEAGDVALDFELGRDATDLAEEARRFFEANLDAELRAHAHFAWEGHHPGLQRKLAEAGLLYPAWPREFGGQERTPYEMAALSRVFHEFGWTRMAISTTGMAAQTVMRFGNEELKREVLPRIGAGDAICSLGFTEPECGSDVAAARTRATRDGETWVIDGQKMFTSGADLAQYVFLLTRTNPDVPKHRGLTMFFVPLATPGIEIQRLETLSDERTNITYYSGVRVPDRYRVGEVDGGWAVLAYLLELEHVAAFEPQQRRMLGEAVEWARRATRDGRQALSLPRVRARLARVAIQTEASSALGARSLWVAAEGESDAAAGPMAKLASTDGFIRSAADLMDLCAPDSLIRGPEGGGAVGASAVEFGYRLSTATSIYGGTSEIMKSIVAQVSLGLPRSRS
jgi:alkylation response protein AidB-like acyl-CoA dehydrogenase